MKTVVTTLALVLFSLSASAKETKGIEGLRQYDCGITTQKGVVEIEAPIGKTILAQSQEAATALYLVSIDANMVNRTLSIDYMVPGSVQVQSDAIKAVNCKLRK